MDNFVRNHLLFATSSALLFALIAYSIHLERTNSANTGTPEAMQQETRVQNPTLPGGATPALDTTSTTLPTKPSIIRTREFEDDD